MSTQFLKIVDAKYMHDYVLKLEFNNGQTRLFDFSTVYDKGICRKLKDMAYFLNFTLDPYTVDWNNEIGFAPEFLYENGEQNV